MYDKKVDRENEEVKVGETIIKPKESLRYLGFQLGKNFKVGSQIEMVCKKARKAAKGYKCLMPNVRGPSFLKEKKN